MGKKNSKEAIGKHELNKNAIATRSCTKDKSKMTKTANGIAHVTMSVFVNKSSIKFQSRTEQV